MKSIEIIIDDLSRKREFKTRLEEAGDKLKLTPEEKKRIKEFWDDRSTYGDVAHVTEYDNTERYPNQFPIPSNVQYSGGAFDSIAASVCIKYFYYKKNFIIIEICEPDEYGSAEGTFTQIYRLWPERNGANLCFFTHERNKTKLIQKVRESFTIQYGCADSDIIDATLGQGKRTLTLRLKSELDEVTPERSL